MSNVSDLIDATTVVVEAHKKVTLTTAEMVKRMEALDKSLSRIMTVRDGKIYLRGGVV